MDVNGSTAQCFNVTPAEVMLLCAMHHRNAGGDPILKLKVIEEDSFNANLETLKEALVKLQEDFTRVETDATLLEDVREKRLESIQKRIEVRQSTIQGLEQINAIRELSPADEFRRLGFKYNQLLLKEFYPGRIPTLPSTFEEARVSGTQTEAVAPKWIVGNNKYANA